MKIEELFEDFYWVLSFGFEADINSIGDSIA